MLDTIFRQLNLDENINININKNIVTNIDIDMRSWLPDDYINQLFTAVYLCLICLLITSFKAKVFSKAVTRSKFKDFSA